MEEKVREHPLESTWTNLEIVGSRQLDKNMAFSFTLLARLHQYDEFAPVW